MHISLFITIDTMSSPPSPELQQPLSNSPQTLTNSPVAISPLRRRSPSPSQFGDVSRTVHHAPAVPRSFDLNDPRVRERQRTMDVDMAIHLSRARRETLSIVNPSTSPISEGFPAQQQQQQKQPEHSFSNIPDLSPSERHDLDVARGETEPVEPDAEEELILSNPHATADDTDFHHHPSSSTHMLSQDNASQSLYGALPIYQPNPSQTHFDFQHMEDFAVVEKNTLGITSLTTRFASPSARHSRPASAAATVELLTNQPQEPHEDASDLDNGAGPSVPRLVRHRKLSQSHPTPRSHRKGIGGKLALFERALGTDEPSPALLPHLGIPPNPSSPFLLEPSFGNPSGLVPGGILNTGHDRPYRFSFYSNALSATIHARSLSELPAEGQTFEDLFKGAPPRFGEDGLPLPKVVGGISKNGRQSVMNGTGGANDSESNTWWLDVQSPTDEEMKMLSKVRC